MLKKLFGGKKKDYFLEVEEAKGVKSADQPKEAPKEETSKAEAPKQEEAAPVAEAKSKKKEEKAAKPAKKSAKKEKAKKSKAAPKTEPTPVAPATAQGNGKVEPQETEFATKYLIVPTGSRRRPGPSLNQFKQMARQVKIPRN